MQNRQDINLIGGGFSHSLSSTSGCEPLYINWIKGTPTAPISMYVDYSIRTIPNTTSTKNYAWLCESRTINRGLYEWCENNIEFLKTNFKYVFTHDLELSKKSEVFKLTQCSGKSVIDINDAKIYEKNKLVSMIASNKIMCEEHLFRQQMIHKFKGKCDHFGRGFNEIPNVLDGLKDYYFSFVLENATYSNMFTEKITNSFMCGTIPIYYGMENIGEFFNLDGIIILNDEFSVDSLSIDLYNEKIKAVNDNFERAKSLLLAEDYIYINYIKIIE